MGTRLINMINLFNFNFLAIFLFELMYKLLAWIIYTPILLLLFRLSLQLSGYGFLTSENLMSYLLQPSTIIIIVILLMIFSLFLFGEMSGIVYGLHASNDEVKVSGLYLVGMSLKVLFKLIISNFLLVILCLITILVFWFNLQGDYFPNFVPGGLAYDYILSNKLWIILFVVVGLLIVGGCTRWIYVNYYYQLSKMSFLSSIQASIELTRVNVFKQSLLVLSWYSLMILSNLALHWLGFSIMALWTGVLNHLVDWVLMILTLVVFFLVLFILPLPFCYFSQIYYERVPNGQIINFNQIDLSFKQQFSKRLLCLLLLVVVTSVSVLTQANLYPHTFQTLYMIRKPEITAHRGYSGIAPENTLIAIRLAIEHGADYIELDVQKTKDDVLVLFHDQTLKRLGKSKNKIKNLTYEQLLKVDIGQSYDDIFHGTKIATLDEALQLCKGKVRLNIELKSSEEDLGKRVVDLVDAYDMLDEIVITSADYEAIQKVKQYREEVVIGYITSALYGGVTEMKEIDIFSLRSSFITSELVKEIHRHGKLVYAWTVNEVEETRRLIEIGVDNIITDYIEHTAAINDSQRHD